MDTKLSTNRTFKRMFVNILSSFVILAMLFPMAGSASAQVSAPHFYASTAHNGIWGADFVPGAQLTFSIYDAAGRNLLWSGEKAADGSGGVWLGGADLPVDLVPGYQVVISMEGIPIKDLVLEAITADLFDVDQGLLQGMAPAGRTLWVGVDFNSTHLGMEVTADSETGAWTADFDTPVPSNYTWAGVQLFDNDGDATEANPPRPAITISTSNNYLRADNFASNTAVTFTVYATQNPGESPLWSDSRTADGNGFAIIWPWEQPLDLVIGNYVIATDGINEKQLVLEAVTLDVFDPDADFLAGTAPTAPDGRFVWTWVGNRADPGCGMGVMADPVSGEWTADFKTQLCDITMDMEGAAHIFDGDGDVTVYHNGPPPPPPSPSLRAHPIWESVDGWYWPLGAELHLAIDDPATPESPDLEMSKIVDVVTEPPENNSVWFEFAGVYDLKQGDLVTITDGTTTRSLVVSVLSINAVDVEADTVAGTAEPGTTVRLPIPGELFATADDAGNWYADFAEVGLDLMPGMLIAEVYDEDGDLTSFELYIPNPHFTVFPEWDWFDGYDWPDGATVNISVEGKPDCATNKESWGNFFNGSFGEGCDVVIGDTVTFTDGIAVREYTVQNLDVTQAEIRDDTVYGTADVGAEVHAWVHDIPNSEMVVTAENGTWMAEFWRNGFDLVEGMCGRSEIRDEVGNATAVDWCYPVPHFTAFPEWDYIEGSDWHPNDFVYLTIEQESPEPTTYYMQARTELPSWDPNRWWVMFDLKGQFDLKAGDTVQLDDDSVTRTMTVRNLSVTNVDLVADVISGTATPGAEVQVWPHETGQLLQAVANGLGAWQVDFTGVFDLVPGTCGRSQIVDAFDNATAVDWCAPKPSLTAFPENDAVEGWEWPDGATVTLTIDNAPGLEWSGTAAVTTWGDPRTFVRIEFGNDYNLQIGDMVTLTDEFGTTRTHTVQNLMITKVSAEDNVIKGIADAGAEVHVWPHATGQEQVAITNPNNKWSVDFSGVYDLMPGEGGRAEVRDELGNATAVDWYTSQPRFTIFPDAQWFDGIDWPDGATVTITVKNKPECTFTRESWGGFFNGGFPEGCVVTAGDHVTFTDGTITRKHTVQNLAITMIDKEANTVMGIADTGVVVYTWIWDLEGAKLDVTAGDGMWQADFGGLGIDLEIGMGIQAEIRDENGNATSVDLPVPDQRIVASITEDWFYLVDFVPGSTLDLSIYENQGGSPVWQGTRTADVNGFAWIDSEGWDLIPGNYLVVSDGNTTQDLVIEGFTFDVFNVTNGQLSGTAPEPYGRRVWVGMGWENDGWSMDVTTDGTGAWLADFGKPVPSDYQWVAAQIFDGDGDASELRPEQIVDLWVAAYTYDLPAGTLADGTYPYHFEFEWSTPEPGSWTGQGGEFVVSGEAPIYDGYVLLRGPRELRGVDTAEGLVCEEVSEINPNQPTRFLVGWLPDYGEMTYADASAHFESITARVVWGDGMSADLVRHEVIPFSEDDWFQYACTFTSP